MNVEELLKDLAMHVAAASPKFLDASGIDEDFKAREAKILLSNFKSKVSLKKMIPQIVEGKLEKACFRGMFT